MTPPAPPSVTITQADWDAAFAFDRSVGGVDVSLLADRFARHRTTAEAASAARVAELAQALANHNDVLRSAYQIAARKGRDTEWEGFTKRAGSVLHFHHDEVEAARALLAKHQQGEG